MALVNSAGGLDVDPWNNQMLSEPLRVLPTTPLQIDPSSRIYMGARDQRLVASPNTLYFGGTDVTGPLHLGHLYCFAAGQCLSESAGGRYIVSLNEVESGTSRDIPVPVAMRNAGLIRSALEGAGFEVHSRLADGELVYASLLLHTYLSRDRPDLVRSIYGESISTSDVLGICSMLLLPVFIANEHDVVCAVYGYDEVRHVELIYKLYRDQEFAEWTRHYCHREPPEFTYILTPLVASSTPGLKMSKSLRHGAIPWDSVAPGVGSEHGEMFARLHELAKKQAPNVSISAVGRLIAQHSGR
ncbi:hypothetical protein HLB23_28255 [Nocardia uniformis]|uniref:Uncharacterized protein n=1 Tax=Nocardia uniformis TaxID=53432 RepID=A0A849CBH9_9NOCA|nr:hypothetical protein [Nocardia uniformis]NNH73700.1 hypothetical protein [Nocardia uniformis]